MTIKRRTKGVLTPIHHMRKKNSAFAPPEPRRRWPTRALGCNLAARATGGLRQVYAEVAQAQTSAARPPKREHTTSASGQLCVGDEMPLIAQRYRYLHTLSESSLSQIVCAVDR